MVFNVSLSELESESNPIIFTNFFDIKRKYRLTPEIKEGETWSTQIKISLLENLDKYNEKQKIPLNIVLFKEAIQYLCKIDRVMNIEAGNLLFIGEGGTGRHSLTKLSAFMNDFKIYDGCKGQNKLSNFRQGIKELFEKLINKKE